MSGFPPLEGVEHRFVDAGGLRMHVAEAGDGPPLLLLHGWRGAAGTRCRSPRA